MKLLTAIVLGAVIGFVVPLIFGGEAGLWMDSWTRWGTIRPLEGSPGLLFSIPLFIGATLAFRLFFNWHTR